MIRAAVLASVLCVMPGSAFAETLLIFGSVEEGGGANGFEKIIDLENGHERTTETQGLAALQHGYDGQFWSFFNGAGGITDMPSAVADRTAEKWIRQSSWRTLGGPQENERRVSLPQASTIRLTFDPQTRRVAAATYDGDYGPVTFKFADWRRVGAYSYPAKLERSSDLDGHRVERAQVVRVLGGADPALLKRPDSQLVAARDKKFAATVPLKFVGPRKNHITVLGQVNGTPAELIFDTGAANILTTDAAKRLNIRSLGGINIGGVGEGTDPGGFAQVDRISVGTANLEDQSFLVIPSPFPPVNGKPSELAGALGYEFLAHYVTTIDYAAETITFRGAVPSDQPGLRVPFVADGHAIAVKGEVNGKPVLLRLDTGDGGNVTFFPAYTEATGLDRNAGALKVVGGGAGGTVRGSSGQIDRFILGGATFQNLPVTFSKNRSGAFSSRALAGNLGAGVLRCFRITFDYPNHQLWLEPRLDQPQCNAVMAR